MLLLDPLTLTGLILGAFISARSLGSLVIEQAERDLFHQTDPLCRVLGPPPSDIADLSKSGWNLVGEIEDEDRMLEFSLGHDEAQHYFEMHGLELHQATRVALSWFIFDRKNSKVYNHQTRLWFTQGDDTVMGAYFRSPRAAMEAYANREVR